MNDDNKLLPLPEPYGYLRDLDGRLQISIGPIRPADRAGGYATPWAAMYDPGRVRANVAHATAPLQAEIEALRANGCAMHAGRWWRVCAPDGSIWCETSNAKEAREHMRPGDSLYREYACECSEWRHITGPGCPKGCL